MHSRIVDVGHGLNERQGNEGKPGSDRSFFGGPVLLPSPRRGFFWLWLLKFLLLEGR